MGTPVEVVDLITLADDKQLSCEARYGYTEAFGARITQLREFAQGNTTFPHLLRQSALGPAWQRLTA